MYILTYAYRCCMGRKSRSPETDFPAPDKGRLGHLNGLPDALGARRQPLVWGNHQSCRTLLDAPACTTVDREEQRAA